MALIRKYQAYHIFKGRDISGSSIIEPPEKDGRKPGETDKKIMSESSTLLPKLSDIGISRDISSLSQKIGGFSTSTNLVPVDF